MTYRKLYDTTMNLRKNRDPLASFAVTVLAKAQSIAKDEATGGAASAPSDEQTTRAIRSFMKGIDETLTHAAQTTPGYRRAEAEKAFLLTLLPTAPTTEQVEAAAKSFIESVKDNPPKSLIGATMNHLKSTFGASLDNAAASQIVKGLA